MHSRLTRLVHGMPTVVSAVVAACAVLVLIGWQIDNELLKSMLHHAQTPMNPATAVCLLLAAVALWLLRHEQTGPEAEMAGRLAAAVLVAAAFLRLGGYVIGGHARVDEFLFRAQLGGNRMAPNTAAGLLLVGLALLLLDVRTRGRRRVYVSQFFNLAVACIAGLSLIGYLFRAGSLYGVADYNPMALNTAACLAALVAGLLCARPDRQPIATLIDDTSGGALARRLLPVAFILPLLLGYVRLLGERHGWFSVDFGLALMILALIVALISFIWWYAQSQRQTDLRRRTAEDALRESEQRHRAVMEQAAEGIYLLDIDTKLILDCNAALERLLGYDRGELAGRSVYDVIEDTRPGIDARLNRLVGAAAPLHGERLYRRKDRSFVEVESSAAVITYAGRTVASTVVHDITARKRLERELQAAVRAEQAAHEKLKHAQSTMVQTEKLASLGQMVAGVAHEINNPLAFVSNNVAVLQRDVRALATLLELYAGADPLLAEHQPQRAAEIRELAERVDLAYTLPNLDELLTRSREGLKRIQQIVKDLREFARLDAADFQQADLNAGIESTINIVRGLAKKRQITVDLQLQPVPPLACFPAKINQVVMNLVTNAIDACPTGGKVSVRTAADGEAGVRIEVADSGPGIPPEIRQRIFDPFFTTKPVGQGTGLGLSISYGIVRDHGGTIAVESEPGSGARFIVRLPVRAMEKTATNEKPATAPRPVQA